MAETACTHLSALLEECIDVGSIVQNPPVCENKGTLVTSMRVQAARLFTLEHICTPPTVPALWKMPVAHPQRRPRSTP